MKDPRNGGNFKMQGNKYIGFIGKKTDCRVCPLRERCLRNETTEQRQVYFFMESLDQKNSLIEKMSHKWIIQSKTVNC